jgi:Flp pilus assembly protein TadG
MNVRPGRRRGQAMVEFALAIIPFLMLVMSILEAGRLVATNFALANAAREGARAGRYLSLPSNATILAAANTTAQAFTGPLTTVVTANNSSCATDSVCVCRYVSGTAATSDPCDTSGFKQGSVVDVTIRYTYGLIPYMTTTPYFCIFCRATFPLYSYYRAVIE